VKKDRPIDPNSETHDRPSEARQDADMDRILADASAARRRPAKIRVSGERAGQPSTWAELSVSADDGRIALSWDSAWQIESVSLTPAAARRLAAIILRAARIAEL
jgi:hypothetical protein